MAHEQAWQKMRTFLGGLVDRFEAPSLNPDAVELVMGDPAALLLTVQDLKDWIHFIDTHILGTANGKAVHRD